MSVHKYLKTFQFSPDEVLNRARKLYEEFRLPLYDQVATKGKPALSIDKLEDLEPYRHGIVSVFTNSIDQTMPTLSGNVFVLQALTDMTAEMSDLAREALVDPALSESERDTCYKHIKLQMPHITSGYLGYYARKAANVKFASMMAFDFDRPDFDPDEFVEMCKQHLKIGGYETLPVYVGPTGKGYRAIFVLRTPIFPHDEYGSVAVQFKQQFMVWYKIMRSWGPRFEPDTSMQTPAQAAFLWGGGKWLISAQDHGMNLVHPEQLPFLGNDIDPQELVLLTPKIRESRAWKTGDLGEDVTDYRPHDITIPPYTPPPPPDDDDDDDDSGSTAGASGSGVAVKTKKTSKRDKKGTTSEAVEPVKFDITDEICPQIYNAFAQVQDFKALSKQGCDKARLAFFSSLGALFNYDERGAKLAGELGKLFRPSHPNPQAVYDSAVDKYYRFANSDLGDAEVQAGRTKYGVPTFFYYAKELGVKLPFLFKKEEDLTLYATPTNLTRIEVEKYAAESAAQIFEIIDSNQRVLIQAPTGTGKTSLMLNYGVDELIDRRLKKDPDILIIHIVPTKELAEEMDREAQVYLRKKGREDLLHRLTYVNGNRKTEEIEKAYQHGARYFFTTPDATKRLAKAKIFATHVIVDEAHDCVPQVSYRKNALESVLRTLEGVDEDMKVLTAKPKVVFLTGTPLPHLADALEVDACVKIVRKVSPQIKFKTYSVGGPDTAGLIYLEYRNDPRPTLVYVDNKRELGGIRDVFKKRGYDTYTATSAKHLRNQRKLWSEAVSRGEPAVLITTCISTMGFNTQATDMDVRVVACCTSTSGIKMANIIQSAGRYRDAREVEIVIMGPRSVMLDLKARIGIPFSFEKQQKNCVQMVEALNTTYPRTLPRQFEIVLDPYNEGVYYMKDVGTHVPFFTGNPKDGLKGGKVLDVNKLGLLYYGFDEFAKKAGVKAALKLAKEWVPDGTELDVELVSWTKDAPELSDDDKAAAETADYDAKIRESLMDFMYKVLRKQTSDEFKISLCSMITAVRKGYKTVKPEHLRWPQAFRELSEIAQEILNLVVADLVQREATLKAEIESVEQKNLKKAHKLGVTLEEVESDTQRKRRARYKKTVRMLEIVQDPESANTAIEDFFEVKYSYFADWNAIINLQPTEATYEDACRIMACMPFTKKALEEHKKGLLFKQVQATGADETEVQRYFSYDAAVFLRLCFRLYDLYKNDPDSLKAITSDEELNLLYDFVRELAKVLEVPFLGSETVDLLLSVATAVGAVRKKKFPQGHPLSGRYGYYFAGVYTEASFGYDEVSYDKGFLFKHIRAREAYIESLLSTRMFELFGNRAMNLIDNLRNYKDLL